MAAARESEDRWRRGEPAGALDGVPVSIKDLLLTAAGRRCAAPLRSTPPGRGTSTRPPWPGCASRARAVGKTTTPELGWKGVTDNAATGVTGNPWDPTRTSGGLVGRQRGGRRAGHGRRSPGHGRRRLGAHPGGLLRHHHDQADLRAGAASTRPSPFGTLAHVGPMTRTAADAALLLDVVSGADARDPGRWPAAPTVGGPLGDAGGGSAGGVSPALGYVEVEPGVAAAFASAVDVLVALGARVDEADPGFADPVAAFETLWFAGAAASVARLGPAARAGRHGPRAGGHRGSRARGSAPSAYLTAMAVRGELGVRMGAFHERLRPARHARRCRSRRSRRASRCRRGGRGSAGRRGRRSPTRST